MLKGITIFMKAINFRTPGRELKGYDGEIEIEIDHIGRFETVNSELELRSRYFGVEILKGCKKVEIFHEYQKDYDDQTMEIIARWHQEDIVLFGYKFSSTLPMAGLSALLNQSFGF